MGNPMFHTIFLDSGWLFSMTPESKHPAGSPAVVLRTKPATPHARIRRPKPCRKTRRRSNALPVARPLAGMIRTAGHEGASVQDTHQRMIAIDVAAPGDDEYRRFPEGSRDKRLLHCPELPPSPLLAPS